MGGVKWRWNVLVAFLVLALVCEYAGAFEQDEGDIGYSGRREEEERRYNTDAGPVPDKLNVHLVSHTHDDVGWLETVDQYFVEYVQYIIDSVVEALQQDRNRKFIYVEQAYFQRWWREQSGWKQNVVRKLVESGQLEFINGGWCMHDEATTHYIDIIDQTTLGHRYIKKQFNKVPRIGWQIDPFGHSAAQGYLLTAEVGFDGLFFARADYQDKRKRLQDRSLEFIWQGSKSLGSSAEVFTGLLYHFYLPSSEFYYEIDARTSVVQDDPGLFDYNVQDRVDVFVQTALNQSKAMRTNHIMWTMGADFTYKYANTWFKQMDKLIHYVNKDGRVNTFYSTPSIYVDSKHAANESWPLKTGDFFPYADYPHEYWTGYFSSRPSLKRYVRVLSGFLLAARQLEFVVGRQESGPNTDALEEAMATVQHHDAVSGTEKQHVANDYAKRLYLGALEASKVMNAALINLISGNHGSHQKTRKSVKNITFEAKTETLRFEQCFLLNISYCPPTEVDLSQGKTLAVVTYNPLGWARTEVIRIPVTTSSLEVTDSEGQSITSQLVPLTLVAKRLREQYVKAYAGVSPGQGSISILVFKASVPPLGFSTYHVRLSPTGSSYTAQKSYLKELQQTTGNVQLRSKLAQVQLSLETGRMQKITDLETGKGTTIGQSYCWYNASDGNTKESPQAASGAYIFRPNSSTCFPVASANTTPQVTIVRGPLVEEVHQQFCPWMSQVIRLYKDADHAEVEFLVGPIPIDDSLGKEVVVKLTTDIESNGQFYTDSNGRDFLQRVRDYRSDYKLNVTEPVAGNYYPLNLGAYLNDSETDLSVLVDRSVGGSSIKDGELELLLHRRLLYDDLLGVHEALNETVCAGVNGTCEGLRVKGTYYLRVGSKSKAPNWRRSQGQRVLTPLQLSFSVYDDSGPSVVSASRFSILADDYQLPPNVALITLQQLEHGDVLLRLAHLYEAGEDEDLSGMATIDFRRLFGTKTIQKVEELTLTGNQKKSGKRSLQWNIEGTTARSDSIRGGPLTEDGHKDGKILVELGPHEIRTFQISFESY